MQRNKEAEFSNKNFIRHHTVFYLEQAVLLVPGDQRRARVQEEDAAKRRSFGRRTEGAQAIDRLGEGSGLEDGDPGVPQPYDPVLSSGSQDVTTQRERGICHLRMPCRP